MYYGKSVSSLIHSKAQNSEYLFNFLEQSLFNRVPSESDPNVFESILLNHWSTAINFNVNLLSKCDAEIFYISWFTERITLDPNTANPRIVLSADNTEIITTANIQNIPDHPDQFDVVLGVMGKTGWSTGRHYWEVSVGGQRCYHIGMASESAQRKGAIRFSPSNGFWTIILNKQGQYRAIDVTNAIIPVQTKALTLGILLDYNKGQISFYDAGVRSHMYTFVGQSFTGKIYPFINICVDGGHTPIYLLTPGSTEWIK